MKVTYIYHSSFAVELEKSMLIFDYYGKGDLPERPAGKQVYFLNSHSHPDHFSKTIFNLREQFGGAEYVLAREIRLKPEEKKDWIHSLKPEYVVDAFNQHCIDSWVKKNWINSQKKPVKNPDLWKRLLKAKEPHQVKFIWVKGHDGHPQNERCDELATTAADGTDLIDDVVLT